jgi:hypothetical protein
MMGMGYTGKNPKIPMLVKFWELLGKWYNSQENPNLGKIEHYQFHFILGIWNLPKFSQIVMKLVFNIYQKNTKRTKEILK